MTSHSKNRLDDFLREIIEDSIPDELLDHHRAEDFDKIRAINKDIARLEERIVRLKARKIEDIVRLEERIERLEERIERLMARKIKVRKDIIAASMLRMPLEQGTTILKTILRYDLSMAYHPKVMTWFKWTSLRKLTSGETHDAAF